MEREFINEATRLANETKEIRKNAANLGMLQEEIQREEMFWQKAADTILKMELEQEEPPRITQTDKKAVIYTQDETKRKVMVTSGVTIGALALILFAFAWFEFQSRKVHTPDEVVEGLGLNLIGTVPDYTSRGWLSWFRGGVDSAYTESMINECVDMACTMLLHVADREKLQIAMITSALDGEGKTSLASHLSASLARAGRRTLLMDSDLRNPTLHRLFQRNRTPGLSELLRDEVDLTQIIRDTEIPNLRLIPAGKGDTTALQALASDGIPKLFEQLRQQYDFVVVDSCPVLPVADAMRVGQHVDGVIFSLLRDVSRLPRVQAACQRLARLDISMLGAVLNGTPQDSVCISYLVKD